MRWAGVFPAVTTRSDGQFRVDIAATQRVTVESVLLGCVGWVSGMSKLFPRECNRLFKLARAGKWQEAMELYRWFMPILHLDARPDLVQGIKLCEQIMGRGSARMREPRLALEGAARAEV